MDRDGALALARGAERFLIKVGQETLRFDRRTRPLDEAEALRYLVHDDGLMRIPVLICDDVLVRGYTEELYQEAFEVLEARKGDTR